ncbi:hypothetical protein [Streptomyces sp. NPDC056308]|uniref:hypothetical protein n=1 Tax=Streptomyces sp. NPDC056308 TaxID=3345780 RepID=UPI0035D8014D
MAKNNNAAPVFTLQPLTPPKPSWWQAHRHQVLSTAALVGGFYIGSHSTDAPAADTPPPHTAPAETAARTAP